MKKKTKQEIEKAESISYNFYKPYRVQITMQDEIKPYIGVFEEEIREQVEILDSKAPMESVNVPTMFQLKVTDITSKLKDQVIPIDAFKIKEIRFV